MDFTTKTDVTPYTDRGVEIPGSFGVHWLTLTVFTDVDSAAAVFEGSLGQEFNSLEMQEYGGLGYRQAFVGVGGFKLYFQPADDSNRVTFVFPGSACEQVGPELWGLFFGRLAAAGFEFNVTRLDLAFDGLEFTPLDFFRAVENNEIRSLAKRKSLRIDQSPYAQRDNGQVGTTTVYFGSRSSERMLRIYDRRGYTRLEMELKGERASKVGKSLFFAPMGSWGPVALSHVRDFVDVFHPWWERFVDGVDRAYMTLQKAAEKSVSEMAGWLIRQVAPALSVVVECIGPDMVQALSHAGKRKRKARYQVLVNAYAGGL